jgi:hypothetical protein
LCYLTDEDLFKFLTESRAHLAQGGVVFIKENTSERVATFDETDNSVARTREAFEKIIDKAGLKIVEHRY